jgi:homopolymeric O-antigen transport system ATP-binding protein
MSRTPAIEIEGLWKLFRLEGPGQIARNLEQKPAEASATPEEEEIRRGHAFWALRDINLTIERGETVGIIGRNGAGKSTLLKILSRVTAPTRGRARVRGNVASLLEVGTGFHQELSGRENISLNAIMLGMSQAEVNLRFDDIVDFSGIKDFLDVPVKHLSSGMRVRLGFSIAVQVDPEILIVDEVLAVGDAEFREKCTKRVSELVATANRTVLVVSHSMGELVNMCSRIVYLENGRIAADGAPEETIQRYISGIKRGVAADMIQTLPYQDFAPAWAAIQKGDLPVECIQPMVDANEVWHLDERTNRTGDGRVRFKSLEFMNAAGKSIRSVGVGEPITFKLEYNAAREVAGRDSGAVSIAICSEDGARVFGMPSRVVLNDGIELSESGSLFCRLPALPLLPGTYTLDVSCMCDNRLADKVRKAAVLSVAPTKFYDTGRFPNATNGRFLVRYQWSGGDAAGAIKKTVADLG